MDLALVVSPLDLPDDEQSSLGIYDTGAAHSFVYNDKLLHHTRPLTSSEPHIIRTAGGKCHSATHVGIVHIKGINYIITIFPAYFVPSFKFNLISSNSICSHKSLITFTHSPNDTYVVNIPYKNNVIINNQLHVKPSNIIAHAKIRNNMTLTTFRLLPNNLTQKLTNKLIHTLPTLRIDASHIHNTKR